MKLFFTSAFLAVLALSFSACSHGGDHDHAHDDHAHDHGPGHVHGEDNAQPEEEISDEIVISEEMASRMGIEVSEILPGEFYETVTTSGAILSSPSDRAMAVAPTSGTVSFGGSIAPGASVAAGRVIATVSKGRVSGGDPDAAARAALEAAKRALDRATPLRAEGIVSEKEYAALKADYEAAKAAYSPAAASGSVISPIAGVITSLLVNQGEYVEAGQPIAQISRSQRLTLRADLPLRHASKSAGFVSANFRPAGSATFYRLSDLNGVRSGGDAVETAGAYVPVYFSFNNPGGEAVPGAMVDIVLLGARRGDVLTVPVSALTEQMGEMYVYVMIDDHGYEKRLVKTGGTDGVRTEIIDGVKAGDKVVTKGAAAVRLAESSGNLPEGHSHSH